jgi:uncharacterized membrane protein
MSERERLVESPALLTLKNLFKKQVEVGDGYSHQVGKGHVYEQVGKGYVYELADTNIWMACYHGHTFYADFGGYMEQEVIDKLKQAGALCVQVNWDNVHDVTSRMLWSIPSWQTPR